MGHLPTGWTLVPLGEEVGARLPEGWRSLDVESWTVAGNLVEVVDPTGRSSRATYDDAGLPLTVTDASGSTTTFAYADGDLTSVTDAAGRTSRVFVDAAGRRVGPAHRSVRLASPSGSDVPSCAVLRRGVGAVHLGGPDRVRR
ncbi:RHS repeat protein [Cellulomonas sp. zg-B89]|nr:RHS repeat protein [Cellulomonas xiejunii]